MYNFPSNREVRQQYWSEDQKKAYWLGIQKGQSIERKRCLALVLGFLVVFELLHWLLTRAVCN